MGRLSWAAPLFHQGNAKGDAMTSEDRERVLDDIENGSEGTFLSAAYELLDDDFNLQPYDLTRVLKKMIEHRLRAMAAGK